MTGSQVLAMNNLTLPTVEQTTNRFAINQGYAYDKNGNITTDPANSGRQFIFNGDNKQTQVKNSGEITIGTYLYDGNGKRVKKVSNLETTVFVYDGLGKLVAEYSTATPPTNPTINYTATDKLGSPRVITDKFGNVVSRRDFMPFGEEIYANSTANRSEANKYSLSGQDSVRKRFTGYEKDLETGLDFAEARYYQNQHGRFTAVDPLLASGKSANPQTFNRYLYCLNNPVILTDPFGLQASTKGEKRKIDVFILYTKEERDVAPAVGIARNNWTGLKELARQNGNNMRIFFLQNGQVSTSRIMKSLTTEGRTTLIITHSVLDNRGSSAPTGEGIAVNRSKSGNYTYIGNYGLTTLNENKQGEMIGRTDDVLPAFKTKTLMIFSCYPGSDFHGVIGSRMPQGSTAYFNNGGIKDGSTWLPTQENAGFAAAKALASNKTPDEAASAADTVLKSPPDPYGFQKDGDRMIKIEPGTDGDSEDRLPPDKKKPF